MAISVEKTKIVIYDRLKSEEDFSFVRFGDGDLHLIDGHGSEQRHRNSPALRKELKGALLIDDPRFIQSSTALSYNDGSNSYFWIKDEKTKKAFDLDLYKTQSRVIPGRELYHALAIQHAFENDPEWFVEWVSFLKDRKVLLVAGDALCGSKLVTAAFNVATEISFPGTTDAYYHLDDKMDEIYEESQKHDVIIPVIGMATRVLAKRLFVLFEGNKTVLDIGVTMDALAEAAHRGWTQTVIDKGIVNKYKGIFLNE